MIVTIKKTTDVNELSLFTKKLKEKGVEVSILTGDEYSTLVLTGNTKEIDTSSILAYDFVLTCNRVTKPYVLASIDYKDETIIKVKNVTFSKNNVVLIGGPCSIRSEEELDDVAYTLSQVGFSCLRGGSFKMRTSPYSFSGNKEEALISLFKVGNKYNLPTISEITDINDISLFEKYVDIIQVGARSMYNYDLLTALGKTNKPIILKRGIDASIEEWLLAAEYILKEGNQNVILCERGIKTFDKETRNVLDLASVALLNKLTHLPVIVDPSHATGRHDLVCQMTLASIASGANGVMIEVDTRRTDASSDANQAIDLNELHEVSLKAKEIIKVLGKRN